MDGKERLIHYQHHKNKVDLNERHANVWGKFLKRKEGYAQKYGAAYADILLQEEREALEAGFNQDLTDLAEQHDQQWLIYYEAPSVMERDSDLPSFSQETEPVIEPAENDTKTDQSPSDLSSRTLFSNPFKQTEQAQKQMAISETKDIDQSQDYMKAMLSRQKANPTKEKKADNDKKPVSMSARFSQGLSYTKAEDGAGQSTGKSRDREANKERD